MNILLLDVAGVIDHAWCAAAKQPNGDEASILRHSLEVIKEAFPGDRITAIVAGPGSGSERRQIFDGYKANRKTDRKGKDAALKSFRVKAPSIFAELGIRCVQSTGGFEAADVIARLAKESLGNPDDTVAVFSANKDLLVLLADTRVKLFHFSEANVVERTVESVRQQLAIEPFQVTDYIAIVGDKAAGLPGAEGIGESGAVQLHRDHKTIDGILAAVASNSIKKDSFTKPFTNPIPLARFTLSRELARLRYEATYEEVDSATATTTAPIGAPANDANQFEPDETLNLDHRVQKFLAESGITGQYALAMGCYFADCSVVPELCTQPAVPSDDCARLVTARE
jgi:5'-3' exonuclease